MIIEEVKSLASSLGIEDISWNTRSDAWWDEFWTYMGLNEARRIKERV